MSIKGSTQTLLLLVSCASAPADRTTGSQGNYVDGDGGVSTTNDDTSLPTTASDGGTQTSGTVEPCNGVDDDGDGWIDEDWPDADGDGRADCLQCSLVEAEAETTGSADLEATSCTVEWDPADDPWDVKLAWEWSIPSDYDEPYGCRTTAIADVDGDGVPEILCQGSKLYVIDGASGETDLIDVDSNFVYFSAHAVLDVDRDGVLDIFGVSDDGTVRAITGAGTRIGTWGSDMGPIDPDGLPSLDAALADLYGDGTTWFINHRGAVSLSTGTKDATYSRYDEVPYRFLQDVAVADIDGDSMQDILTFRTAWDADGWPKWYTKTLDYNVDAGSAVIFASRSGPSTPLVAWTGSGVQPQIWTSDGSSLLFETEQEKYWTLSGCAGDLDNDGDMEFVVSSGGGYTFTGDPVFYALEADGSQLWATTLPTLAEAGGVCTMMDFTGDGSPEVVVADRMGTYILDGPTGIPLWSQETTSSSLFITEQAIPIDLDGDGSVELVRTDVQPVDGDANIQVFRHATAQWPPGAPFWANSSWNGTQLQTNGTLPRQPRKPWETSKLWRGMPTTWIPGADLDLEVIASCVSEAQVDSGEVRLMIRVVNRGPEEANTTGALSVTGLTDAGEVIALGTDSWGFIGTQETGPTVEILTDQATAARGITAAAAHGTDGALTTQDCNPDNNVRTWDLHDLRGR